MAKVPSNSSPRRKKSLAGYCERCLPGKRRQVSRSNKRLCESCRVHYCHKRKELQDQGERDTLTVSAFLQRFPAWHNRGICQRCPPNLNRPAFRSGLCRWCSNSWTAVKKAIKKKKPWARLPTAKEFIRNWPKRGVYLDGKYYIVS